VTEGGTERVTHAFGEAIAALHELRRSVVTSLEFSNTPKLSVIKSVFVQILTHGHETWVMT